MERKRKLLVISVLLIALSAIMAGTAVYAWFFITFNPPGKHEISIGKFDIQFLDTSGEGGHYTYANSINVTNVFPLTGDQATGKAAVNPGESLLDATTQMTKYVYRFRVTNYGTIPAMFRFKVSDREIPAAGEQSLYNKLSYRIRYWTADHNKDSNASDIPDTSLVEWSAPYSSRTIEVDEGEDIVVKDDYYVYSNVTGEDFQSEIPADKRITLQERLDALTIVNDSYTEFGNLKSAVNNTVSSAYIDICVWVSQYAGLNVMDKTANFNLTCYAMQSSGGAKWSDWEIDG